MRTYKTKPLKTILIKRGDVTVKRLKTEQRLSAKRKLRLGERYGADTIIVFSHWYASSGTFASGARWTTYKLIDGKFQSVATDSQTDW